MRSVAVLVIGLLTGLALAGCAAASGYDPKRYANNEAGAPDPETAPLASAPKTTIPDPKKPPLPPAAPAPAPAPPPPAEEDAGPPDAGPKPKAKPATPPKK